MLMELSKNLSHNLNSLPVFKKKNNFKEYTKNLYHDSFKNYSTQNYYACFAPYLPQPHFKNSGKALPHVATLCLPSFNSRY